MSIAVDRNTDTLASIVTRINGSAAGVTAAYDASRDALVLTGTTSSEELVSVGDDTSGFLAAAKLASANTVRGNIRDDRQVLSRTSQFAGVTSGSFSINGTTFSIDVAADSLNAVIGRINAGDAGVTAAYDAATDSLVLTRSSNSKELIAVGDDSTGFLAAAHLSTGNTVRGHVAEDGVALRDLTRFSSVVDGSFVVGGKRIAVATTDSVQSIVDRINSADAGVTASFDAVSNTIGLASIDSSEEDVAISGDTSGFLTAAGLEPANTLRGNIRDDRQVLARTSQFGNVSSGSFTINGTAITVDSSSDTLDTVLARINAAGAGVTAAYDADTDRLVLTGTENSQDLIAVANDSSGFLAAARLETADTVRGHLREDGVALANIAAFAAVTDGTFTIDGQEISVDTATDTVSSLIDRINGSGARVVASYDGDADRITLQATYDSEDDVPLGSDTSGFLAAAHLSVGRHRRGQPARRPAGAGAHHAVRLRRRRQLHGERHDHRRRRPAGQRRVGHREDQRRGCRRDGELRRVDQAHRARQHGRERGRHRGRSGHQRLSRRGPAEHRQHRPRQHSRRPAGAVQDQSVRRGGVGRVHRQRRADRRRCGSRIRSRPSSTGSTPRMPG